MKNILITGAGGFIGSHLTEKCVEEGFKVRAFLHYNSRNIFGWLENSKYYKDIEFITGDIRDYDSVYKSVKGCDTILHLAALIGIPYSYVSPLAYIKTNIEGTYNVLESSKQHGVENIVVTSTSETYGSAQYVPMDESHPLIGQSPYAATKIAADSLALSFFFSFGLPVKVIRPFNTYGPRQSGRAIIPSIIIQLLSGIEKIKLGNMNTSRDLLYVKDTVNAFLEIAKTNKVIGEVTNVGTNKEISVAEIAKLIQKIIGNESIIYEIDNRRIRPSSSEVMRLKCDNSKILEKTLWKPQFDLEIGLKNTIEWLNTNLNIYKPEIYNI